MKINTYDIDGVIYLGEGLDGLHPGPNDIIVTGRSTDEEPATRQMLDSRGIKNIVLYNRLPFAAKSRVTSADHKVQAIRYIKEVLGYEHGVHFEDDPVQINILKSAGVRVVSIGSAGLVDLENVWHEVKK
jgi:microsomal dipeptidase-like Zn-dependent dipeptidase